MITRTYPLFGKQITITLFDTPQPLADTILAETYAEGLRLQRIFNFYDPASELSLLNKQRSMAVSDDLLHVIKTALSYCAQTNGAYDITKGKQFLARKRGLPLPSCACSYKDVAIKGDTITLTHADALIDLGSIAKGYITDKLIAYLEEAGIVSGVIDARGDLRLFGDRTETVGIQHPRDNTHLSFTLTNNAVATSGDYNQYHTSYEKSHLIGAHHYVSVTVIADTLAEADAAATCLSLLDKTDAAAFLNRHPHLRVLSYDNAMNITARNFETT